MYTSNCYMTRFQEFPYINTLELTSCSWSHFSNDMVWMSLFIIQQIVTMPIYGKEALNICHPT